MILSMYIGHGDCPYCYSIAPHSHAARMDATAVYLYSKVFKSVRTYTIHDRQMIKFKTKEV